MRELKRGSKNEDIKQRSNSLFYPNDVYDDEELPKGSSYKDFKNDRDYLRDYLSSLFIKVSKRLEKEVTDLSIEDDLSALPLPYEDSDFYESGSIRLISPNNPDFSLLLGFWIPENEKDKVCLNIVYEAYKPNLDHWKVDSYLGEEVVETLQYPIDILENTDKNISKITNDIHKVLKKNDPDDFVRKMQKSNKESRELKSVKRVEANDKLLDDLKSFRKQIGTIEGLATKLSTKLEKREDSLDSDLLRSLSNFVSDCEGLWDTLAERILSEDPDWDS